MKKQGKILAGVLLAGALATTAGMAVGCGSSDGEPLSTTTEVYGFAGATTALLAGSSSTGASALAEAKIAGMSSSTLDTLKENLTAGINNALDGYMQIFDSVVGGTSPVEVVENVSDKDGFAHKLTITVDAVSGETVCVLYYNETLTNGGDAVTDSDEEERATLLEGEMYLNGSTTPIYVYGGKEVDADSNEHETEIFFEASYFTEDNDLYTENKVRFEQEIEVEGKQREESYKFVVTVGGFDVYNFDFEMEKVDGKIAVEYEQEIGNTTMKFEVEKSGNTIKLTAKEVLGLDIDLVISVTVETDATNGQRYIYSIPALGNFTIEGAWRA